MRMMRCDHPLNPPDLAAILDFGGGRQLLGEADLQAFGAVIGPNEQARPLVSQHLFWADYGDCEQRVSPPARKDEVVPLGQADCLRRGFESILA